MPILGPREACNVQPWKFTDCLQVVNVGLGQHLVNLGSEGIVDFVKVSKP